MPGPVEIRLPVEASPDAHAQIPEPEVPRVAAALRSVRRDPPDARDDGQYVADCVMDYLREVVLRHSRRERVAQAVRDADAAGVDW